jgi:phosphatidylserine decarboxylase
LAIGELILHFPYPSPLIKPFLPPRLKWPTEQVEAWVEAENFDSDYLGFFARDPTRITPIGDNFVSPSDGIVKNIVVKGNVTYLVIGLSFWDVHVVRTPVAGAVTDIEQEGYSLFGRNDSKQKLRESVFLRGKAAPVQQIITINSKFGIVKVRLITSYWASRLKVYIHLGDHLEKGQRIGRILLGSTVVGEFPNGSLISVKKGQRVVGGETIISEGAER